jgi:HKD family nuclease
MSVKLIINSHENSHSERISELIQTSNEVFISVAFLKDSGLNEILPFIKDGLTKGTVFKIIAGQHFALTEPKALWTLFKLFKATNSILHLAHLTPKETFHPKMFLFQTKKDVTIIVGSANLTSGGFVNNFECSLSYSGTIKDLVWQESKQFFDELFKGNSVKASRMEILRYEKFYFDQKSIRDRMKAAPKYTKSTLNFNYLKLKQHLNNYNKAEREQRFIDRMDSYAKAKQVLNKMLNSTNMSKSLFSDLLDELVGGSEKHIQYWHSGGLSRGKTGKNGNQGIYDRWKYFIKLVEFVKVNKDKSAAYVFEYGKKLLNNIPGAGVNYLTEIMMTYNPDNFANMNNNPLKVLRTEAACNIKASAPSYNGEEYEEYCELILEINSELGLRNMLEADSFFNDVYWPLKRKGVIK